MDESGVRDDHEPHHSIHGLHVVKTLTGRKVFFSSIGYCDFIVYFHLVFPLLPPTLSVNTFSFSLLGQNCLQILCPAVDIFGVIGVLERARTVQIGKLLGESLRVHHGQYDHDM